MYLARKLELNRIKMAIKFQISLLNVLVAPLRMVSLALSRQINSDMLRPSIIVRPRKK